MAVLESMENLSLLESSEISSSRSDSLTAFVPEKIFAAKIDGVHTDFVINDFRDRVFIVITQSGNIGTLVSVTRFALPSFEEKSDDVFTVKTVFGNDRDEEYHLMARFVYEQTNLCKPALFALGIKDFSPRSLRAIRDVLIKHKTW